MQVDFDAIELENFKSFIGKPQILELDKLSFGVHYMQGRNEDAPRLGANGCGKTTLWDALCWCLFGQTVDGLKNPDVRPWTGEKKTRVTVWLHVGNKTHEVTRTANPNSLTIGEKAVGQEQIENLVGFDLSTFTNTVLLGQGQPLFFDLKPSEKMAMFSSVLQLDKWEQRSGRAAQKTKTLELDYNRKVGELQASEREEKALQDQIERLRKDVENWSDDRRGRADEQEARIKEGEQNLKAMDKKLGDAQLELDSAATEMKALDGEIEDLEKDLANISKEGDGYAVNKRAKQLELDKVERELRGLGESDECPTCGQPLKGQNRAKHRKALQQQIKDLKDEIAEAIPKKHIKELAEAGAALRKVEAHLKEFRERANAAQRIVDLQGPQVATEKARIVSAKERLAEIERETNPYKDQLERLRTELRKLTTKLDDLEDEVGGMQDDISDAKYWVKGFKDVRLYIIDEVVHELELTTNAMLAEVGLDGWEVKYDVERETKSGNVQRGLNVMILSPLNDKPVKWESWSGGETQRLRIVGALALAEVLLNHAGVQTGLTVLDEPASYLSREGVRELCEFLADYAKRGERQIIYIDHQAIDGHIFASRIKVVKTKKGSFIE